MPADGCYALERLGVIMEANEDAEEEWGVLNPACARTRESELLLFPRLVARGNFSRIGAARVVWKDDRPSSVERIRTVLQPDEVWEQNARTAGVEDPRVTYIDDLGVYVMTYSAYGPLGSRVGVAVSSDALQWQRLGPAHFGYEPELRADLNLYMNKDAAFFPAPVAAPDGTESFAMLHRPVWTMEHLESKLNPMLPQGVSDPRPGIWVSFAPADAVRRDMRALVGLTQHQQVALPEQPWERLKIGAGTPPVRVPEGWLFLHHGVDGEIIGEADHQPRVRYCAGSMILDADDVTRVLHRSDRPLLEPDTRGEQEGIVPNVVFPTGIDWRTNESGFVFYGMADSRIGVAAITRSKRAERGES